MTPSSPANSFSVPAGIVLFGDKGLTEPPGKADLMKRPKPAPTLPKR